MTVFGRADEGFAMLLSGLNHVAILTQDTDRFLTFYRDIFEATLFHQLPIPEHETILSIVTIGPRTWLNVFEIKGNSEAQRQVPMFGRGRIDHLGLEAASQKAFDDIRERLIAKGATDGFVTDFGTDISLFFRDPDGLEGEVCLIRPGAQPTDMKPPGTPAAGYEPVR